MRKILQTLQKQHSEKKNQLFSSFASQFVEAALSSLIHSFNAQVGKRGWSAARVSHDAALIEELQHRGIDVSAVYDGKTISFAHHIGLDEKSMKIIVQD